MSDRESSTKPKEGLTKPLVNNVGGVVDQDGPAADQLLKGEQAPSWDKGAVVQGDTGMHHERRDESAFIPDVGRRIVIPEGSGPSDDI